MEDDEGAFYLEYVELMNEVPWALRRPFDSADDDAEEDEEDAPRTEPVAVAQDAEIRLHVRLHLPQGFAVYEGPDALDREGGPVRWTLSTREEDGVYSIDTSLRVDSGGLVSPDEAEAGRELIRAVADAEAVLVLFEHSGKETLRERRYAQALTEARQELDRAPDSPGAHARWVEALIEAGMVWVARPEAEALVKAFPESARAWSALGRVRMLGDFGEAWGEGSDRPGAVAAWREAVRLDPTDRDALLDLVTLLEVGYDGTVRSPGSDPAAAARELIAADFEWEDAQGMNMVIVADLLSNGTEEELRAFLEETPQDDLDDETWVLVATVLDGVEAGQKEARKRHRSKKDARKTLEATVDNLLFLRRMGRAAELLELIAGDEQTTAERKRIEALKKAAAVDLEALAASGEPIGALLPLVRYMDEPVRWSTAAREVWPSAEDLAEREEHLRKGYQSKLTDGGQFENLLRLGLGSGTWEVEELGPDLATIEHPFGTAWWVVKEKGSWRLGGEVDGAELGVEIRSRLARRDLEGARALLDVALLEHKLGAGPQLLMARGKRKELGLLTSLIPCVPDDLCRSLREQALGVLDSDDDQAQLLRLQIETLLEQRDVDAAAEAAERLASIEGEDAGDERFQIDLARMRRALASGDAAAAAAAIDTVDEATGGSFHLYLTRLDYALLFGGPTALEALHAEMLEKVGDNAMLLNGVAWSALFLDDPGKAVEIGERAVEAAGAPNAAYLHTLATAYAEAGRVDEALERLAESRTLRVPDRNVSDDWYVMGRIAENLGLEAYARAAYERMEKPKDIALRPQNTWHLKERRLKALGE